MKSFRVPTSVERQEKAAKRQKKIAQRQERDNDYRANLNEEKEFKNMIIGILLAVVGIFVFAFLFYGGGIYALSQSYRLYKATGKRKYILYSAFVLVLMLGALTLTSN